MAYYAERNPMAALRMLEEIDHAAQSLVAATLPAKGKPGRVPGTRELVLGTHTPYILIFREVAKMVATMQILRVMHTARKYP